jgi:ABC-type phosphate/phosphonate transport system substrate-binding protein
MTTRDKLKKEIDKLPDDLVNKVYQFINNLRPQDKKPVKLQTYKLKGQLDDVNVREKAYE